MAIYVSYIDCLITRRSRHPNAGYIHRLHAKVVELCLFMRDLKFLLSFEFSKPFVRTVRTFSFSIEFTKKAVLDKIRSITFGYIITPVLFR